LFRLNLLSVKLPKLTERITDVPLLAEYFMNKFRKQYQQPDKQLHSNVIEWMKNYDWPGNVRELDNFIHRHFLLTDEPLIKCPDEKILACQSISERRKIDRRQQVVFDSSFQEAKARTIDQFEERYLSALLIQTQGNITKAAQLAHKERRALGKLIKKHNINPEEFHPLQSDGTRTKTH
jgi:DNA-binding NtrC family response regulator